MASVPAQQEAGAGAQGHEVGLAVITSHQVPGGGEVAAEVTHEAGPRPPPPPDSLAQAEVGGPVTQRDEPLTSTSGGTEVSGELQIWNEICVLF